MLRLAYAMCLQPRVKLGEHACRCPQPSSRSWPVRLDQKLQFVTGSADVGGSQGRRTAPAVARQVWGLTAARAAFSSAPAAFVVEVCVFSPNNHASARAAVGAVQFRRKE